MTTENAAAEKALVGSILFGDAAAYRRVSLPPEAFADPISRVVWSAIGRLIQRGGAVDLINVEAELTPVEKNALGPLPASWMSEAMKVSTYADTTAILVRRAWRARRMESAGMRLADSVRGGEDADETLMGHRADIAAIAADAVIEGGVSGADLAGRMTELFDARYSGESDSGIPTGLAELDDNIRGWVGGRLYTVAARPGQGKTSLAVGAAVQAMAAHPVLFVSLEMGREEIGDRIVSAMTGIDHAIIQRGALSAAQRHDVIRALTRLHDSKLTINDRETNIDKIIALAYRWHAQHGGGLMLVDYIQLVGTRHERGKTREREVAEVSRAFKLLAKELRIPVVMAAQLNRGVEHEQRAPRLSDLRESGAIEQDSDVVIFPYHEPQTKDDGSVRAGTPSGPVSMIVAKNRHGKVARFMATWDGPTMSFRDFAREPMQTDHWSNRA